MEVTLKFGADEEREAREAMEGSSARSVLWELDCEMRKVIKHEDHPDAVIIEVERIRKILRDLCDGYGINLDE